MATWPLYAKFIRASRALQGHKDWLDWFQPCVRCCATGVKLMLDWSQTGVRGYLGSMPCIRISSCLHSTMSLVNMAWKYGMEAARTIR